VGEHETNNTMAFLEIESSPADCVAFGLVATLCTIFSAVGVYNFLISANYYTKVQGSNEVSLEEFTTIAEQLSPAYSSKNKPNWNLSPSGFSDDEKELYQDFLVGGKPIAPELMDKFEKRKSLEKRAYEEFLSETMLIRNPTDKHYTYKVIIPLLFYLVLHIATYLVAFFLGSYLR
jgi:hypothetical protein